MDDRVQSLDTPVHNFREPGLGGYLNRRDAGFLQLSASAASRKNLDTHFGESRCKWNYVTLIRNADKRASYCQHEWPLPEKRIGFEFLAQRTPVDAENPGCLALITVREIHDGPE